MKKITYITLLGSTLLMTAGCVHFMALPLDTAEDNDPYFKINSKPNTEYIEKFTATDLYTENISNVWGFDKDDCRDFNVVTDVAKEGSASLLLSWDKTKKGCDWIGTGWAWNNWQTMDMTNIVNTWGFEFWVRTREGKMGTLPVSMSLLDNSDKASETVVISNKCYKGFGFSEEWKRVVVPLAMFRIVQKGLNPAEIKQLIMTFDGTASIYLDEFKVVDLDTTAKASK